jgi:hypothetical protein
MKTDTIYMILSQLPGLYMPDNITLYTSYRQARQALAELRREYHDNDDRTTIEHNPPYSTLFVYRDDSSTPHYCYTIEPASWRDLAKQLSLTTRQQVLEYEY